MCEVDVFDTAALERVGDKVGRLLFPQLWEAPRPPAQYSGGPSLMVTRSDSYSSDDMMIGSRDTKASTAELTHADSKRTIVSKMTIMQKIFLFCAVLLACGLGAFIVVKEHNSANVGVAVGSVPSSLEEEGVPPATSVEDPTAPSGSSEVVEPSTPISEDFLAPRPPISKDPPPVVQEAPAKPSPSADHIRRVPSTGTSSGGDVNTNPKNSSPTEANESTGTATAVAPGPQSSPNDPSQGNASSSPIVYQASLPWRPSPSVSRPMEAPSNRSPLLEQSGTPMPSLSEALAPIAKHERPLANSESPFFISLHLRSPSPADDFGVVVSQTVTPKSPGEGHVHGVPQKEEDENMRLNLPLNKMPVPPRRAATARGSAIATAMFSFPPPVPELNALSSDGSSSTRLGFAKAPPGRGRPPARPVAPPARPDGGWISTVVTPVPEELSVPVSEVLAPQYPNGLTPGFWGRAPVPNPDHEEVSMVPVLHGRGYMGRALVSPPDEEVLSMVPVLP